MKQSNRKGAFRATAMVFVLTSNLFLGGCVGVVASALVGGADIMMSAGPLVDRPSTDAATDFVEVPHTDVKQLTGRMATVAPELGYRVESVDAQSVCIVRRAESLGGALIGRDWAEIVAVTVDPNGHTLQIIAKTQGNGGHGSPGTAQKLIDELKPHLLDAYASNK